MSWFPMLCVVMALGVALIAFGCSGSRAEASWAQAIFWLGFLLLLVPSSMRLCMENVARQERLGILITMAFGYYLIKVLYSPLFYAFSDELQHWRSANNIIQTNMLFQENPSLQASTFFPGLEIVTDALIKTTGLSIYQAGTILIGVVHSLMVVALFLLYERLSRSAFIGSIAALVYFASPSFMLYVSQFAYEPLALSLFYFGLYLLAIRTYASQSTHLIYLTLTILLFLFAVIITHHVTSYFFAILLSLWMVFALLNRNPKEKRNIVAGFAFLAIAGCVLWPVITGSLPLVLEYIGTPIQRAINGVFGLAAGTDAPREFFQQGGNVTPLWLQIPSFISVVLILLTLPLGLLALRKKMMVNNLVLTLCFMSLGFVVAQVLRLAPTGLAMTNRLASPIFLPLSFVLAVGAIRYIRPYRFGRWWRMMTLLCWVCLINIGSVTAIIASWQLPGPHDANVYTRTIDKVGITSALWAKKTLGPNNRFGADFINVMIMASYGEQNVITQENDFFAETSVFGASEFTEIEKNYIRNRGVEYLVIDNRLFNKLVYTPQLLNPESFPTKLDGQESISRIFDAGRISIYHLGFVSPFGDSLKLRSETQ